MGINEVLKLEQERDALKASNVRLQRQIARAKDKHADLVDAVYEAAKDAALITGVPGPIPAPMKNRRKAPPEEALIHFSDWQCGKALCDQTPVLTEDGWKLHGDLGAGDRVYGPDGVLHTVTAVTGSTPQECYLVTFDDGTQITASGDHLWQGYRRAKSWPDNSYSRRSVIWTTSQIAEIPRVRRGYLDRAFHVDLTRPIEFPEAALPVDPYLLGLWLGDGTHTNCRITVGDEDVEFAATLGRVVKYPSSSAHTLIPDGLTNESLREAGVFGNKHIPGMYLAASIDQRLDLLRGLMDSDGTISKEGVCEFSNTRRELTEGVEALLSSLGYKFTASSKQGRLYGVDKKMSWRVFFRGRSDLNPFRMPRKAERIATVPEEHQTRFRFVADVQPVGIRSAQCITVEGGLYLAGRNLTTTHNCTEDYDTDVCVARVRHCVQKVRDLTEIQRKDHPVPRITVLFGGDHIEGGGGIFPGQAYEVDSSGYAQLMTVSKLMAEIVLTFLEDFDHVTVNSVPGNHGRLGMRGQLPRVDNMDLIAYSLARAHLGKQKRVTWQERLRWWDYVEIGNYKAVLIHGDQVKGWGGGAIPINGLMKKATAWAAGALRVGGKRVDFHDMYLGHYHQDIVGTLPSGGRVRMVPSTESGSDYAAETMAAAGDPAQRLMFVHPEKGRITSEHMLWLDEVTK